MTHEEKFMAGYFAGQRGEQPETQDVTYLGGYDKGQQNPRN